MFFETPCMLHMFSRSKLLEEFSNSINSVTHQCDADVVTINEKEKEWEVHVITLRIWSIERMDC